MASFLGYGMSAARRFIEQLPVTVVSVATCAVSAYALTPRWGLMGAAAAILLATLAQIGGSFRAEASLPFRRRLIHQAGSHQANGHTGNPSLS